MCHDFPAYWISEPSAQLFVELISAPQVNGMPYLGWVKKKIRVWMLDHSRTTAKFPDAHFLLVSYLISFIESWQVFCRERLEEVVKSYKLYPFFLATTPSIEPSSSASSSSSSSSSTSAFVSSPPSSAHLNLASPIGSGNNSGSNSNRDLSSRAWKDFLREVNPSIVESYTNVEVRLRLLHDVPSCQSLFRCSSISPFPRLVLCVLSISSVIPSHRLFWFIVCGSSSPCNDSLSDNQLHL
jgi:hypothetical protein